MRQAPRGRWPTAVLGCSAAWSPAAVRGGERATRTDLQRAVAVAPHEAERLSWTDWAGVRAELGARLLDRLLDVASSRCSSTTATTRT